VQSDGSSVPLNIGDIADNLEERETGLWLSKKTSAEFSPEEGAVWRYDIVDGSFWCRHRVRCIMETMRLYPPAGTLLDIGGGNGYVASALNAGGWDTILVEPWMEGIRDARNKGVKTVICSTLQGAGFKKHSIPAVGAFDVLEHIEDDQEFLQTVRRLLVPNGRLYITVPAYNFLWSVEDTHIGHHRRYTLSGLAARLASAGFRCESSTYIFSLLAIPILLFRTLPWVLGMRGKPNLQRDRREHGLGQGMWVSLMERGLSIECTAIRKRIRIPFGGSCLVVAKPL
jgi:SAM-dependent methyltransferase